MDLGLRGYHKKPPKESIDWAIILLVAAIVVVVTLLQASAQTVARGEVMQVKDGDTVVIAPTEGGQFFTCRLSGIDAPGGSKTKQTGAAFWFRGYKGIETAYLGAGS